MKRVEGDKKYPDTKTDQFGVLYIKTNLRGVRGGVGEKVTKRTRLLFEARLTFFSSNWK